MTKRKSNQVFNRITLGDDMKESCEVFGETIEGENREDLRKKVRDKLLSMIEAPRELKNKRIEAKLAAKQRL